MPQLPLHLPPLVHGSHPFSQPAQLSFPSRPSLPSTPISAPAKRRKRYWQLTKELTATAMCLWPAQYLNVAELVCPRISGEQQGVREKRGPGAWYRAGLAVSLVPHCLPSSPGGPLAAFLTVWTLSEGVREAARAPSWPLQAWPNTWKAAVLSLPSTRTPSLENCLACSAAHHISGNI